MGMVYSYSERQFLIYSFIKRVGPSPEDCLETLFGLQTAKALYKLKQSGYLRFIKIRNIEFWLLPDNGYFDPLKQETLAWFAVRLEQAEGKYKKEYGISPKGNKFMFTYSPGQIHITDEVNRKFVARLEDLRRFPFKECLKWEKHAKTP